MSKLQESNTKRNGRPLKMDVALGAPSPRFFRWINTYGPQRLGVALGVSYWTVLSWRKGANGQKSGSIPDPKRLGDILRLARGKLTAADIYPPPSKSKK